MNGKKIPDDDRVHQRQESIQQLEVRSISNPVFEIESHYFQAEG